MSRMAHGKLRRSRYPHALIKRIDTTRARALPGVYAVIMRSSRNRPEQVVQASAMGASPSFPRSPR